MRTSANSHPESVTSHTSSKKPISAKDKLDEINQQLAAVRLKLATLQHDNKSPHKSPPREHGDKHGEKHGKYKSAFHHPKLDLVMGEIVNSPYMTAPMDRYPQETFSVPQKIQELKNKHSAEDIPREELPYDVNEIKHRFLDEVVNYNVSYAAPHMVCYLCLYSYDYFDFVLVFSRNRIVIPSRHPMIMTQPANSCQKSRQKDEHLQQIQSVAAARRVTRRKLGVFQLIFLLRRMRRASKMLSLLTRTLLLPLSININKMKLLLLSLLLFHHVLR